MTDTPLTHTLLKDIGSTLLAEGKTIRVTAEGCSMFPTIRPGSVIFIDPPATDAGFTPGEIIAYRSDKGFIVHRIVRSFHRDGQEYFVTRGDSSRMEDEPVTTGQIAGRVTRKERRSGKQKPLKKINFTSLQYGYNIMRVILYLYLEKIRRIITHERKTQAL
ncbi:MAG: signal peptidase I [Bacteroidales bacterium]|jgi:signal peptidase I